MEASASRLLLGRDERPSLPSHCSRPAAAQLLTRSVFGLGTLLAIAGVFLLARRMGGAMSVPLHGGVLLGLGVVLTLSAGAFRRIAVERLAIDDSHPNLAFSPRWLLWSMPSLVLLCWLVALSLPGSSPFGLAALWAIVVGGEAWSWRARWSPLASPSIPSASTRFGLVSDQLDVAEANGDEGDDEAPREEIATQARRRSPEGAEVIEGTLRVELSPGQRYATAHIAICPPLAAAPECWAEQTDGPTAEIKPAQVLGYGVRFEIKLERAASEATQVVFDYIVSPPEGQDSP